MSGVLDGATWALDLPAHVDAVWGDGTSVLWEHGEPLMIVGPEGVGKTTLTQQLVLRLAGIGGTDLLGYAVAPSVGKVLYLALDRPSQARRSLARMVSESDRAALQGRVVVWEGQLPFDIVSEPGKLTEMTRKYEASSVVIDCLKDVAGKLSDEAAGSAINSAMQQCCQADVQVCALHHQRKAQGDNKKPRTLADVYGSRWLTAGCGSVLVLWGESGDPIVELRHLKQPSDEVGPLTLLHDNVTGSTTVEGAIDVVDVLGASLTALTAKDVAGRLFKMSDPKKNDVAKAKRRLTAAVSEGRARRIEPGPGFSAQWAITGGVHAGGEQGCTPGVHGEGARCPLRSRGDGYPATNGGDEGARIGPNPDGETSTTTAPSPTSDEVINADSIDDGDANATALTPTPLLTDLLVTRGNGPTPGLPLVAPDAFDDDEPENHYGAAA